jgi:hypothetical protein
VRFALLAWCIAAVVACSAGGHRSAAPMAPMAPQTAGSEPAGDPHAEIEQLSQQIEHDRAAQPHGAGATPMVAGATPREPRSAPLPPSGQDPTCHPAPSDTCTSSCKLSDSICTNAEHICKLAGELAGDDWAAKKCTSARATCDTAHTECCGCQ